MVVQTVQVDRELNARENYLVRARKRMYHKGDYLQTISQAMPPVNAVPALLSLQCMNFPDVTFSATKEWIFGHLGVMTFFITLKMQLDMKRYTYCSERQRRNSERGREKRE